MNLKPSLLVEAHHIGLVHREHREQACIWYYICFYKCLSTLTCSMLSSRVNAFLLYINELHVLKILDCGNTHYAFFRSLFW